MRRRRGMTRAASISVSRGAGPNACPADAEAVSADSVRVVAARARPCVGNVFGGLRGTIGSTLSSHAASRTRIRARSSSSWARRAVRPRCAYARRSRWFIPHSVASASRVAPADSRPIAVGCYQRLSYDAWTCSRNVIWYARRRLVGVPPRDLPQSRATRSSESNTATLRVHTA